MVDRLEGLDERQRLAFDEFKRSIGDLIKPHHTDQFLARWIVGKGFDAKKAEAVFRKIMDWRQCHDIDNLMDEWKVPEVLQKFYAGGFSGFDREGFPVWINLVSYIDLKGFYQSVKKADLIKMNLLELEMIQTIYQQQSKKLGKNIDQTVVIMDLKKLGRQHLWKQGMDCFIEMLNSTEENYPDNLRKCFIINAPAIFPLAYSLVKPFLQEGTKKRVFVLGKNWKQKLLEHIDADQLPVHWGGTQLGNDGNPYCSPRIILGGEIPKCYYLNNPELQLQADKVTKVTVQKRSSVKVEHEVTVAGSVIRWEFKTEYYDIGFGVFHKTKSGKQKVSEMDVVESIEKVNSHKVPQDGCVFCDQPGIYVVVFDNSYSWFHNKTLTYHTEVTKPGPKKPSICTSASDIQPELQCRTRV